MIIDISSRWPFLRVRRGSLAKFEARYRRSAIKLERLRGRLTGNKQAAPCLAPGSGETKKGTKSIRSVGAVFARRRELMASARARIARPEPTPPDFPLLSGVAGGLRYLMPDGDRRGLERRLLRGVAGWNDLLMREAMAGGGAYLDIGANVGMTCLPHAVSGRFAPVIAVEPEARNFACLDYNARANGLAKAVTLLNCALGATCGEASLAVASGSGRHYLAHDAPASAQAVRLTTVDALLGELGVAPEAVALVKCDTQGAEAAILSGAAGLLACRRAVWHLEVWPKGLRRAGYEPEMLFALVEGAFSQFIDTREPQHVIEPIARFRDLFARLRRGTRFTDALLLP